MSDWIMSFRKCEKLIAPSTLKRVGWCARDSEAGTALVSIIGDPAPPGGVGSAADSLQAGCAFILLKPMASHNWIAAIAARQRCAAAYSAVAAARLGTRHAGAHHPEPLRVAHC